MPVIDEIIDANFKSGTSASGKPWSLMKVKVGSNEATIFAPAAVGDEVKLNYNEQYKNYSAEKMTQARKERDDIIEKLDEILNILKAGSSQQAVKEALRTSIEPDSDLSEIPF